MTDPVVLLSTGDVLGPNTSTDGTMVLFDGTSGKKIKGNNAVVTGQGLALLDDPDAASNRATIGLNLVNNTSDINKPVSTAQQTALNLKANLNAPAFTGWPTVQTAATDNNTANIANTAFVQAVSNTRLSLAAGGSVLGVSAFFKGISGGYGNGNGGSVAWGASIWGIGASYVGSGAADDYTTSQLYGMAWLRDSHTQAIPQISEGLYVCRAGSTVGGIGLGGIWTSGIYYGNGVGLTNLNAANLATGILPDARLSGTYNNVNITGLAGSATTLTGLTATIAQLNTLGGIYSNVQIQLNAKAPSANPTLTGNPTAPTQTLGNSSTRLANTEFVQNAVNALTLGLGDGQTWKNLTASRAANITYTNTTGRTIAIFIDADSINDLFINGVKFGTNNPQYGCTYILPAGNNIRVTFGTFVWWELS